MESVEFYEGFLTEEKGGNLKLWLHWSYVLYQQALDMGVQDTHIRLLGEIP